MEVFEQHLTQLKWDKKNAFDLVPSDGNKGVLYHHHHCLITLCGLGLLQKLPPFFPILCKLLISLAQRVILFLFRVKLAL
jgi:hypothetical protein